MQALVLVLMVPLFILNIVGGITSGIWLAILGEWRLIGYGISAAFIGPIALSIVMMPSLLFAFPAASLLEKGKVIAVLPFLVLSQIYTYALISIWCLGILFFFLSRASADTFWPILIWSYGIALAPWVYLAQKDNQSGQGDASSMTTFFAQIAYVVTVLVLVFSRVTRLDLVYVFGAIMLFGLVIQSAFAFAISKQEIAIRRENSFD